MTKSYQKAVKMLENETKRIAENSEKMALSDPLPQPSDKNWASKIFSVIFIFCFAFFFCAFSALCVWQIKRLGWKENLIATANAHTHLPAVPAPPLADWDKVRKDGEFYDYRVVFAKGHFLHDKEILVKASVLLNPLDESGGAGYWVMTPLQTANGNYIFINRGFIPFDKKEQKTRLHALPQGDVQINGLLRLSEGPGYLFTKNDPKNHIWYNRQLPAFADSIGLPQEKVAPYFIDADKTPNPGGWPRGGLTVVNFPNNHLVYAITWFCGAVGVIIAAVLVLRNRKNK